MLFAQDYLLGSVRGECNYHFKLGPRFVYSLSSLSFFGFGL